MLFFGPWFAANLQWWFCHWVARRAEAGLLQPAADQLRGFEKELELLISGMEGVFMKNMDAYFTLMVDD